MFTKSQELFFANICLKNQKYNIHEYPIFSMTYAFLGLYAHRIRKNGLDFWLEKLHISNENIQSPAISIRSSI